MLTRDSIQAIQQDLQNLGLAGWLFVNHHGMDPIAVTVLGQPTALHSSRRWWYYLPATGEPVKLLHSVEPNMLHAVPGETRHYASRRLLEERLAGLLPTGGAIAMQYSPRAEMPMISLVDAGTVELIRGLGVSVVSSAEILQRQFARLSDAQIASHLAAMKLVHEVKDEAFALIGRQMKGAQPPTDLGIQNFIVSRFAELGLTCDGHPPIVGVNENAADPHFSVDPAREVTIRPGDRVLLDLWARQNHEGSTYADICWCGFLGAEPEPEYARLFGIAMESRDRAVDFLIRRLGSGQTATGADVDRAAREVFEQQGVADFSVHRTGHSIDTSVHGRGANIDSYETTDTRLIIPRTCFSIEPALYAPPIGVRTEINVLIDPENKVVVTGPVQRELTRLD